MTEGLELFVMVFESYPTARWSEVAAFTLVKESNVDKNVTILEEYRMFYTAYNQRLDTQFNKVGNEQPMVSFRKKGER